MQIGLQTVILQRKDDDVARIFDAVRATLLVPVNK
jgi:hypothetical protein